jgi:hypothetical protein
MSIHNDHKRTHRSTAKTKAAAEREAAIAEARDKGRNCFIAHPEEVLVAIARLGADLYHHDVDQQVAYLQGYIEARTQRDAFRRGE